MFDREEGKSRGSILTKWEVDFHNLNVDVFGFYACDDDGSQASQSDAGPARPQVPLFLLPRSLLLRSSDWRMDCGELYRRSYPRSRHRY